VKISRRTYRIIVSIYLFLTLLVTAHCFGVLLEMVLNHFREKHKDHAVIIGRVTQLYGFGNYNANLPNLGQDLEKLTGGFINGKYLYDKQREVQKGKPILKLNGYYKIVLFQYIGYEGIEDFTKNFIKDEERLIIGRIYSIPTYIP